MPNAPWASGPAEILQHGLSLLTEGSDRDRRLAMLSIDNAVELTLKTYIGLPRRVTGIHLARKRFQEISESFPGLLDAVEQHASEKIAGINLGEIEWYHRLRNELYHQGNGLTIERQKVEMYAELGKQLFESLFEIGLEIKQTPQQSVLADFIQKWGKLEQIATALAHARGSLKSSKHVVNPMTVIRELAQSGLITRSEQKRLEELRQIRNQVIHGQIEYQRVLTPALLQELSQLMSKLETMTAQPEN